MRLIAPLVASGNVPSQVLDPNNPMGNLKARLFTLTISIAGTCVLVYSLYRLYLEPSRLDWIMLLALTMLLSWRAEVWIPGVRSKITLTDTFVCTAMILLGPWVAAVLASIDGPSKI